MLREGGIHLEEFLRLAAEASDLAFFAGENQMLHFSYEQDMRDATNLFAAAIGELWYVLLQAIVAYILKRAAELAGPATLESASKLTARSEALQTAIKDAQSYTSKLGPAFGNWLDKNFEKIRKSVEDHPRSRQLGDEGGGEPAPIAKPSQPAKTTAAPAERTWSYQPKQTGRIEPGAVPMTRTLNEQIKAAELRAAPTIPSGWPSMSNDVAQTFGSDPAPVMLEANSKLYRVIGNDYSASGSYWSLEPPPPTEAQWRGEYAVLDSWNGDGGFVEYTVPEGGLNVWEGPVAPQRLTTNGGFALPGGGTQIWVPKGVIDLDASPLPTPWNN